MQTQGKKAQNVFFVDDQLVERLLRGDVVRSEAANSEPTAAPLPKLRPASSPSLSPALQMASQGQLDEAVGQLEKAAVLGENPAEVYAALGNLRFEQRLWEEAARCYGRVAEADPKHATAFYNQGLCLERLGKLDEAGKAFEAAIQLHPERWQAQAGLGLCRLQTGDAAHALECFEAALAKSPDQDRALFGKAVALHHLGRLDEASVVYQALLPDHFDSPELLGNLVALAAARRDEVATRDFAGRLLKLRPKSQCALEALTALALERGDFRNAVLHCSELVKVAPESYQAWFNLGVAAQKTGSLARASEAYGEAIRLRPEAAEASANLSAVLEQQGDRAGARRASEQALTASPDLPGAMWNLAVLAEREGNTTEACQLYSKLLNLECAGIYWGDASFRLGFLQLQNGNSGEAVASFEKCLKIQPDWVDGLLNLGLAYWKCDDLEAAQRCFDRTLGIEPKNPDALRALLAIDIERKDLKSALELLHELQAAGERPVELSFNLGLLLQNANCFVSAEECYRIAIAEDPRCSQALLNLGHVLKAEGKEDEAREAWMKALEANPALAAR